MFFRDKFFFGYYCFSYGRMTDGLNHFYIISLYRQQGFMFADSYSLIHCCNLGMSRGNVFVHKQ